MVKTDLWDIANKNIHSSYLNVMSKISSRDGEDFKRPSSEVVVSHQSMFLVVKITTLQIVVHTVVVTHQQTAVVLHNQITILDLNNLETAVD